MDKINPIFNRSKKIYNDNQKNEEINFQIISWNDGDFEKEESDSDIMQYEIYISGVNKIGQSVSVRVTGFTPYFYVGVPNSWSNKYCDMFFKYIKERLYSNGYGLVKYDITKRKKLYPYLAGREFKFIRLIFSTDCSFNKCRNLFFRKNQYKNPIKVPGITIDDNNFISKAENGLYIPFYEVYDTNVKHINRFCHILNIETTGWIKISEYQESLEYTSAQINITTFWKNIKYDDISKHIAPLTIFSWDIECVPENTELFPNPEIKGDIIKQISVVLVKYSTDIKQFYIFTSSPCSNIKICKYCNIITEKYNKDICDNLLICDKKSCCGNCRKKCESTEWIDAIVIESNSEKKLLQNFCDFIGIVDFDIITGFNTWNFDDMYFWKRSTIIHEIDMSKLSRINNINTRLVKKELSSSAYGNNEFNYLFCPGRQTFDMLVAIRREYKLESYSLNAVSIEFLNKKKLDLPYSILFKKLNGNSYEIAECAAYCIQDSNLPANLLLKLNILPNYIEMAKTTHVPMEWLLFRGQQCKVFSLIAKAAREEKYVIPFYEKPDIVDKYKGATVINPLVGLHFVPTAGLDFASLYPSIMMAYNMCYSTYIESKEMLDYVIEKNIPYHTIKWQSCQQENCKSTNCNHKKINYAHSFVQIEDNNGNVLPGGVRGILGSILKKLMQGRKKTKKDMREEKDKFMYDVLNGKQLAQKVTMNSVYGFTGASNGILPLKPIAASVTATGRVMIDQTSKMAAEQFGGLTVYGDSIPPNELISLSIRDTIIDVPISEFANNLSIDWQEYRGFKIGDLNIFNKEYKNLDNLEYYTLTHKGFKKIKKVIRHNTNKKIYKITTKDKYGVLHTVKVTEGHSLILPNGNTIKAEDLKIGTMLYDYSDIINKT